MLAAQRAAAQIEKGLRDQAHAPRGAACGPTCAARSRRWRPSSRRRSRRSRSPSSGATARDALGLLPWYVIIGPSASGKTTAIRSSGLKLPLGKGGEVRGVGGTRNCDWWMTNEAILLDTAGRWSTEDDDRDEWLAFLDLLKATRPKKPINGILLAVSATDLQGTEEEIAALARDAARAHRRGDRGRLEMVVPVYLLVTKCDLVSGFVETFGDLKDRERGQIWGFTLPLVGEHGDHVDAFAQHFDELARCWSARPRCASARSGGSRRASAIYAFPRSSIPCARGWSTSPPTLFDQNVYQDGPIMRGVYFTSGTQEGSPVDRVMASMAEAFGVAATGAGGADQQAQELLRPRPVPGGGVSRPRHRPRAARRPQARTAAFAGERRWGPWPYRSRSWCYRSRRISRTASSSPIRAPSSTS